MITVWKDAEGYWYARGASESALSRSIQIALEARDLIPLDHKVVLMVDPEDDGNVRTVAPHRAGRIGPPHRGEGGHVRVLVSRAESDSNHGATRGNVYRVTRVRPDRIYINDPTRNSEWFLFGYEVEWTNDPLSG